MVVTVRPVTPRVVAIRGHLQFYRDLDFYDLDQDDLAVGDPMDPEWPDQPIRFKAQKPRAPHHHHNTTTEALT